jgi:peroxiredoxin
MKKLTIMLLLLAGITSAKAAVDTATVNNAAPAFTLKDMAGKTVSLSDYKGKVVVLDFWATWCVPCRNSFPAVQATINKYKNDKDVVFLFVDTREKVDNYKELITKFLEDTHYDFRVLLDEHNEDGRQGKLYKEYAMPGIPTKYIIDKNGVIRFMNIGFMPGRTDEQVSDELSKEIETAKKA